VSILFNVAGYEGSGHFDLFVIRNAPVEKFADADESFECADKFILSIACFVSSYKIAK